MSGKPKSRKDLTFDEITEGLANSPAGSLRESELLSELQRRHTIAQIEAANAQRESALAQKAHAKAQEENAIAQRANAQAQKDSAMWLTMAGVGAGISALASLAATAWPLVHSWLTHP
jgi:hypothetical protein